MNCAPITVTAGKAKRDNEGVSLVPRADSYPELFVANLDSVNSCKTSPGTDVVYPDPGDNVEKLLKGATPSFATISASGCVPKSQTQGAGSLPTATAGDAGGAAAGTTPAASASTTASSDAGASSASSSSSSSSGAAGSGSGGVFATTDGAAGGAGSSPPVASSVYVSPVTVPSPSATASASDSATASGSESATDSATGSASAPASSTTAETTATGGAATPSATLSPTGSGSGNSTGSGSGGGSSSASGKSGACTSEGMFNCVGSQYQQCASGAWTAMKALPGGTTCTQGESETLWARDVGARANGVRKMRWGGRMPVYSA